MTKKTLEKMPENIQKYIEIIKGAYQNQLIDKDRIRDRANGYTMGLKHAGLITDRERMALFSYITL